MDGPPLSAHLHIHIYSIFKGPNVLLERNNVLGPLWASVGFA